jgi:hypothetical protein
MTSKKTHIVMTSGGVGSFVTLAMVCEEFGVENVVSLFADTLIEDEDVYRFLEDTHAMLGIPLTRIADGRTPWEVFEQKKFIGNSRVDLCSRILKREIMDKWVETNYPDPESCVCYIGIDWSEKHRHERLAPRKLPYVYKAPMVEKLMMLSPEAKQKFCLARGVKPPRSYAQGFAHANCGGFCVKAGLGQFKMLYDKLPERYLMHENIEQRLIAENPKLKPFLRKADRSGERFLTMRQYREEYLMPGSGEQLTFDDLYDFGGCGCAIDYKDDEIQIA